MFSERTSLTLTDGYRLESDGGGTVPERPAAGYYRICTPAGETADSLLVVSEEYPAPTFTDGGIIYQIFVDRFARGGDVKKRGDAVYYDWDSVPEYRRDENGNLENNSLFGGTLYGVAEKLPYIASLGASAIYLSPVCSAYSNHKYDTCDYLRVDEGFGGDAALRLLTDKAKKYGIRIILDGVFNHVGDKSLYFRDAVSNPSSPYRDWFSFTRFPDEYDCWWGCRNLPKTVKNDSFRSFICDRVIPHYMEMGIGGFRLDVVDEYDNAFTERIVRSVKSCDPGAEVIGEVWEDAAGKVAYGERKSYFYGCSLDAVTNYPLRDGIVAFFLTGDPGALASAVSYQLTHYPRPAVMHNMNMLGTHDTERILTVLGGGGGDMPAERAASFRLSREARSIAVKRLKAAYALLVALPGTPCLYYGDEAGMEGKHDPFNRRAFPWGGEDKELTAHFRACGCLRKTDATLVRGDARVAGAEKGLFAVTRTFASRSVTAVAFSGKGAYPLRGAAKDLITGKMYYGSVSAEEPKTVIFEER